MQNLPPSNPRTHESLRRVLMILAASLLGLLPTLSGCADESEAADGEATVQALFAEGRWVSSRSGAAIPAAAFEAGFEKNRNNVYYICRVSLSNGNVLPGKLYSDRCHIGMAGKEYHYESYQVLVDPDDRLYWRNAIDGAPPNPVVGGTENGSTVYICQGGDHYERVDPSTRLWTSEIPGKLVGGVCYTTYDGEEKAHRGNSMRRLGIR